ncbi:MAG TPA: urate hydroxylase PuuD [Polyangia bacterium]
MFALIWMGLLYFFNLVNVPFQGALDKELKPKVNPALLLRALYWFRWGAMYTFIFGWLLFFWHYLGPEHLISSPDGGMSGRAMWIMFGGLLGTIMWFNVWFVIWPRQKLILDGMAAGTPHPDAAKMAGVAGKASRFNTYASGPLVFAMLAAPHFSIMSGPVLVAVSVLGLGFWYGMIKRSFKVKTTG